MSRVVFQEREVQYVSVEVAGPPSTPSNSRLGNEEMESSMPKLEETTAVKSDGIEK